MSRWKFYRHQSFFFHLLPFDSFHILSYNIKCVMYSIQYEHHHNKKGKALILQINKHFLCRCYWSKFIIICRSFYEFSLLLYMYVIIHLKDDWQLLLKKNLWTVPILIMLLCLDVDLIHSRSVESARFWCFIEYFLDQFWLHQFKLFLKSQQHFTYYL